ncbi:class I SAM-dependent methyltransferase [Amycolatopsis nigrescens]|uniref:class I SAM-dependent methyltransferase n=1 Tax=Amycolatopsis nigrescens TaxID=381445 RepID=UPI001B7F8350|nr:methyltransferase domain-containing protein [Amycolatopsis nigrescens]
MTSTAQDLRTFVSAAARRPAVIGAIAPSSATLADRLASVVPSFGLPTVVELGPGTGSVSAAIARRLPEGGRQLAVEIDPELVEYLRRTRPELEVSYGDAADLRALLAVHGVGRVDAVVSGLPWALVGTGRQERILAEVTGALTPDGTFTTFAYLHALPLAPARRFRALLRSLFDEVLVTSVVWRNTPPAISYVCRRPVVQRR